MLSSGPFFYFLLIASITPGPNNVMLTASGMNFGYQRTIPHMLGIVFGFMALLLLCTYGIGSFYKVYPQIQIVLKIFGAAYLLYLAFQIVSAGRLELKEKVKNTTRPLSFIEAFGFQFINPKGVVFGLAAINLLPPEYSLLQHSVIVVVSVMISAAISTNAWTLFGKVVANLFRNDKMRFIINMILALLLLGCLPLMIL